MVADLLRETGVMDFGLYGAKCFLEISFSGTDAILATKYLHQSKAFVRKSLLLTSLRITGFHSTDDEPLR